MDVQVCEAVARERPVISSDDFAVANCQYVSLPVWGKPQIGKGEAETDNLPKTQFFLSVIFTAPDLSQYELANWHQHRPEPLHVTLGFDFGMRGWLALDCCILQSLELWQNGRKDGVGFVVEIILRLRSGGRLRVGGLLRL
jgi:hypothetical protein